jgi:hypothetical protein
MMMIFLFFSFFYYLLWAEGFISYCVTYPFFHSGFERVGKNKRFFVKLTSLCALFV